LTKLIAAQALREKGHGQLGQTPVGNFVALLIELFALIL